MKDSVKKNFLSAKSELYFLASLLEAQIICVDVALSTAQHIVKNFENIKEEGDYFDGNFEKWTP